MVFSTGIAKDVHETRELGVNESLLLNRELRDISVEDDFLNGGLHFDSLCFLCVRNCGFVSKSDNFFDSSLNICAFD
jgi:hypothetical protein